MFVLASFVAAGCGDKRDEAHHAPPPVNVQPTCPDFHRLIGGVCTIDPCPQGLTRDAPSGSCVMVEAEEPAPLATSAAGKRFLALSILDDRALRHAPKPQKLLITEISNVERLYKSTAKTSPDRPRLMARLGDGYSELGARAALDAETATHPKSIKKSKLIVRAARKNAIKYYKKLLKQYPQFCRKPPNGCADDALHYLALELVLGGNLMKARKAWLELVKNHPQSRHVAAAHIGFGHLFEAEAQADPQKWTIAQKFFQEAADKPANRLTGLAWFRLGRVLEQVGDGAGARVAYEKSLDFVVQNPSAAAAEPLGRAARNALDGAPN